MLYVTTRNTDEVFTAYHTFTKDRPEDGGFYIPFRMPEFSREEILSFTDKSFGQIVAELLNSFFSCGLTGWDVDFCIGKNPVKLVAMSHKILIAECWHNHDWNMERFVNNLTVKIAGENGNNLVPTNWVWIAVRIAFLFGIFSEIINKEDADSGKTVDVAVTAGDFSMPMAVWYAKKMGLPIGNIICGCNENSALWDLFHHGQLHTDVDVVTTLTPRADVGVPSNLERLVNVALGREETVRYLGVCQDKKLYTPDEEQLAVLREGIRSAVVSQKRMDDVIRNVYNTSGYLLGTYSALAFGSLQDYRAGIVESRTALIISERSPVCDLNAVSNAAGISKEAIQERFV